MQIQKIEMSPKYPAVGCLCGEMFLGPGKNFRMALRVAAHAGRLGAHKVSTHRSWGTFRGVLACRETYPAV